MERVIALFALALTALALPTTVAAQDYPTSRTIATERWVEEWDPASQRWVRVSDSPSRAIAATNAGATTASVTTTQIVNGVMIEQTQTTISSQAGVTNIGFAIPSVAPQAGALAGSPYGQSVAQYGPFRVLDGTRAAIVDTTDQSSPEWFDMMMRNHPEIEVIEMIEAPGTRHDIANLKVGRRIRAAGLRTHVPAGGSVRSGAVELFLAGTTRTMADSAQFAVHSWLDNYGREPGDFPEDHPANRLYLDYYVDMGMSESAARDFYTMTNSVPHTSALWLGADDMRPWVREQRQIAAARKLAAMASQPLPVLASDQAPLELPQLDLDEAIALAPVNVQAVVPTIAYADLSTIAIARTM